VTEALTWETIGDEPALVRLEPEWWQLWHQSRSATPFQSPAWLLSWWRAFAPGEMYVLAARQRERLVALAPFYLETSALGRRLLPIGISVSDYQDILASDGHAQTVCETLSTYLYKSRQNWDVLEFTELPTGAQALALAVPSSCEEIIVQGSACPVVCLPGSVEALVQSLPARRRRSLRLARNRASRRSCVEIVTATSVSSALAILHTLFRLHQMRWEEKNERGVLSGPRVQLLHLECVPRLMEAGLLRMYELRFADESAAIYYGFLHGKRAYGYITGFNPAYSFESPGAIVLAHALEEALREGACEFHFLRGQEAYKYKWGAVDRWNLRRIFRQVNVRAQAS
jgi:CelD/BcsL family acetyltransferase involved in cellulose biosynthesis